MLENSTKLKKPPIKSSKKAILQDHLAKYDITFDPKLTQKQLWALVEPTIVNAPIKYEIDTLQSNWVAMGPL